MTAGTTSSSEKSPIEQERQIRELFAGLKTRKNVAWMCGISEKKLIFLLYRMPEDKRYIKFQIKKKSGAFREIASPVIELKEIQLRLNYLFQFLYQPRHSTHGFAKARSIVSNAEAHLRSKYVFNLDLANFFPSIHFGRVMGMFKQKPFYCQKNIAIILAQICCFEKKLPQGAPTSPIISNIICAKMDVELQRFAKKHACVYTRYADDITFSTKRNSFSQSVARLDESQKAKYIIGEELAEIIERNKFAINEAKLRLQARNRRQLVTGLKVNEFPNVSKKLLSEIRAMLHAWEKFDLKAAEEHHMTQYYKKQIAPFRGRPPFKYVLKGKIEFVGMVRGKESSVFLKLASQLTELDSELTKNWDLRSIEEKTNDALCVLETPADTEGEIIQGTGFFLKDYGLVTCFHVFRQGMEAFKNISPFTKHPIQIKSGNEDIDLAVIESTIEAGHYLDGDFRDPRPGEQVILRGFPKYAPGASAIAVVAQITGSRLRFGIRRFLLDKAIVAGNSGGPVLDMNGKVIGVAATGVIRENEENPDEQFGIIPIKHLKAAGAS